jgi:hypothetical protein
VEHVREMVFNKVYQVDLVPEVPNYFKVFVRMANPPLSLDINYLDGAANIDLFGSFTHPYPDENHNQMYYSGKPK